MFVKPELLGSVPVARVLQHLPTGQMDNINNGTLKTIKKHY